MDDKNHQTFRHGAGLRSSAPQMGRRTNFRMARPLSQTGKGLRSDHRQRRCLGARRPHPHPHATARKILRLNAIIMSQTLTPWPKELELFIFLLTSGWKCGLSHATQSSDKAYREGVL